MVTTETHLKTTHKKQTVYKLVSYALIVLFVCIKVFTFKFGVLDELWEYDFSRAITMGYIPYRDFPDCSMPLFGFIFSIPLFFSRTLIAYRAMTAFFFILLFIAVFNVINRKTSVGYAICAVLFGIRYAELATYNMLMMFWAVLCLLGLDIKNKKLKYFLIGFLTALAPLTKQSSGGIMLIIVTILMAYWAFHVEKQGKLFLIYLAGAFIPCFIFLIYLIATASFAAFLDCCLFGLFAYADNNTAVNMAGTPAMLLTIVLGIAGDFYFIFKKKDSFSLFHFCAGIAVLSNAIPIFEYYHLVMGGIFFLIPIALIAKEFAPRFISINMTPVIAGMICVFIIFLSADVFMNPRITSDWEELVLIPSSEDAEYYGDVVAKNHEYEAEGKKVIVFSSSAVVISIMDKTFNQPYDMFLNGNMGTADPMSYAKNACADSNNIILIPSDYNEENWQNPDGIYEYVTSHCTEVYSAGNWVWYSPKAQT